MSLNHVKRDKVKWQKEKREYFKSSHRKEVGLAQYLRMGHNNKQEGQKVRMVVEWLRCGPC